MGWLALLTATLFARGSADYIGSEFFVGPACGGDVFETSQIFPSGCSLSRSPSPSFQSYSLSCVNASAAMLHLFASKDCSGKNQPVPFTPVEFGCNASSIAPNTLLTSCKPGAYTPLPNALDSACQWRARPQPAPSPPLFFSLATLFSSLALTLALTLALPRSSLPCCSPLPLLLLAPCLQSLILRAQAHAPPRPSLCRRPPFAWATALTPTCPLGRLCPSSMLAMTRT